MANGDDFGGMHEFDKGSKDIATGDWFCRVCGESPEGGLHISTQGSTSVESGKRFIEPHIFNSLGGTTDKDGNPYCKDCLLTDSAGNHIPKQYVGLEVHEFEAYDDRENPDRWVLRELCGVCGKPEKDRLHFHEFKLVFGGYNCQVCGGLISDEVHKGVDPEGITERPVRELVETKPDDEFWVDEDKKVRKKLFGRIKVDPQDDGDRGILRYPDEEIDEMILRAEENYVNREPLVKFEGAVPITTKKKSVFTTGDKFIVGGIIGAAGLNIVAAAVNIVASIIN